MACGDWATLFHLQHFPNNQLITRHTPGHSPAPFGTRWHLSRISTVIYCLSPSVFCIFQHSQSWQTNTQLNMHKPRLFSPSPPPPARVHNEWQQPRPNRRKNSQAWKWHMGCNPPPRGNFPILKWKSLIRLANILHDTWQLFCFSRDTSEKPRGVFHFPHAHMLDLTNVLPQSSA